MPVKPRHNYGPPETALRRARKSRAIEKARRELRWTFYVSRKDRLHRWRAVSPNGRIVGASSQGYKRRQDAIDNARLMGY